MKIKVTMKCGHEETKDIYGSTKEREKKIWYFENCCSCDACIKKVHEEANAKAVEELKELALTELEGSEKQIAWANTIRSTMMKDIENELNKYENASNYDIKKIVLTFINMKKSACWFIDNRDSYILNIIRSDDFKNAFNKVVNNEVVEDKVIAIKEETIENKVEEDVITINISNNYVYVYYKKDEQFIERMHYHWFKWNGEKKCWYNYTKVEGHTAQDLAAEIYKDLSDCGFTIICDDNIIVEKAINNTFKTEDEVKEEIRFAKEKAEKEKIEKLSVEISYKDFKDGKWTGKFTKQVYDSYNARKKTIKVIAKTVEDKEEIEAFYDTKRAKVPQEVRDFKDGITNSFEIIPEVIDANTLSINIPDDVKNEKFSGV